VATLWHYSPPKSRYPFSGQELQAGCKIFAKAPNGDARMGKGANAPGYFAPRASAGVSSVSARSGDPFSELTTPASANSENRFRKLR